MNFLKKTDYSTQIKQDVLDAVLNNDDTIRTGAELAAQAEIESYLRTRFDVVKIFTIPTTTPAPTEETPEPEAVPDYSKRHPLILMYMIDITLFHLHSRINPRNVSEIREVRYNQAIEWLKAVSKGNISPDLPTYAPEEATKNTAGLMWGSWPKNVNYY